MVETEYGTREMELQRAVANGPPYHVRYTWAGGTDPGERRSVTAALAACFGVRSLVSSQTIERSEPFADSVPARIRYLFWLLRVHDLSLGFTHGWEDSGHGGDRRVYRVTVRIDRARLRGYEEG